MIFLRPAGLHERAIAFVANSDVLESASGEFEIGMGELEIDASGGREPVSAAVSAL